MIPYLDKTAAPDIYDEILTVISNVHASDMQTIDLDEIGLYDFMAEKLQKNRLINLAAWQSDILKSTEELLDDYKKSVHQRLS